MGMKVNRFKGLSKTVLGVFALMLLLGACSKKEQVSTPTESTGSDGPRQVRFANWWGDLEIKIADEYFKKEYTPKTGIEVIFEHVPRDEFIQKMVSQIVAGDPPDLVLCNSDDISSYARNDLMLGLNTYMERDNVDLTSFYGTPDWIIDRELYGLPSWYGSWYFFVNVTMLEKAGIEVPRGSWTWDQLREIALKLNDPANGIWGIADGMNWDLMYWYMLNGAGPFSDDMSTCTINSPEMVYAFDFLKKLIYQDKVMPEPSLYATVSPDALFADGKAAIYYGGTWSANYFRETIKKDFTWDVIFAPTGPGAKGDVTPARSSGMFIPANCKNIEAAWEVMKHWGSVEGINNIDIAALTSMPSSPAVLESEAYNLWPNQQPEHFNKEFFRQVAARAKYFPFTHYYLGENVRNAFTGIGAIVNENLDSKKTLDEAYNTIMANWDSIEYIGKK
jgi:multiple sugar transport system substrate-binding protein